MECGIRGFDIGWKSFKTVFEQKYVFYIVKFEFNKWAIIWDEKISLCAEGLSLTKESL